MENSDKTTPINGTGTDSLAVYLGLTDTPKPVVTTSSIRTMQNDIASAVKDQNESLVSIAVAEYEKGAAERAAKAIAREAERATVSIAPRPIGRIIIVVMLILVLAGVGLAYKFVLPKLQKINTPKISIPSFGSPSTESLPNSPTASRVYLETSIITAQTEKRFDVGKETTERMFAAVASERVTGGAQGDVKNLYFYEEVTGTDASRQTDLRDLNLLSEAIRDGSASRSEADTIPHDRKSVSISAGKLLIFSGVPVPEVLTRSLENTFMVGLLNEEAGSLPTPFIILKVSDYDTGFAGMLEWESSLPRLFDIIFNTNIESSLSHETKMRDVVLSSRDARVLEITSSLGIAYSFANPSTIVIAGSRNALEKLLSKAPTK